MLLKPMVGTVVRGDSRSRIREEWIVDRHARTDRGLTKSILLHDSHQGAVRINSKAAAKNRPAITEDVIGKTYAGSQRIELIALYAPAVRRVFIGENDAVEP